MNDFSKLLNHDPRVLVVHGTQITVHEGVFDPDPQLSHSTSIILNHLPDVRNRAVLDMGTGTGIIALHCAQNGASTIVAVDNDSKAIKNAQENIKNTNHTHICVVQSDLFENIPQTFDYIFANLPINRELWSHSEDPFQLTQRFLANAMSHLNTGGQIYLTWFSVSAIDPILNTITNLNLTYNIITEQKFGYNWYLLKITQS